MTTTETSVKDFNTTITDYYILRKGKRTRSNGEEEVYWLTFFSKEIGEGRQICYVYPNQLQQIIEEYVGWDIVIEK